MNSPTSFAFFCITGTVFAVLGILLSAAAYTGKNGERYSPLNHFVSELGEVGVSRLAWTFNLGLILSGLCLIPACIVLGLLIPGTLSKIGMAAGVISALGLSLVGVFPMNNLKPHGKAAVTFFRAGLMMVLSFSLAIGFQAETSLVLSRTYSLAGLPAILAFGGFLFLMWKASQNPQDPPQPIADMRPKIWLMPIVEWAIFLTIILWFLLISAGLGNH